MSPPMHFARRGGKVFSSQVRPASPTHQRKSGAGLGKGIAIRRRPVRVPKDTIFGITTGDLRRLARRGGVKRISKGIYQTARSYLREFLTDVLRDCLIFVEHGRRKTVLVTDVIYALRRKGRPIYGFETVSRNFARR